MRITPHTVYFAACLLPVALVLWYFCPQPRPPGNPARVTPVTSPGTTNPVVLTRQKVRLQARSEPFENPTPRGSP